jgi:hypothetical protein
MTAPKGARVAFHPTTKSQWAFTLPFYPVMVDTNFLNVCTK